MPLSEMMREDASARDNGRGSLERALQELEALESIYGYEPGGFIVHSTAELAMARSMVHPGVTQPNADVVDWTLPQLELEIRVELDSGGEGNDASARLRCAMPPGYPTTASLQVSVVVDDLRRAQQNELTAMLQAKADELLGEESVVDLVQALEELYCSMRSEGNTLGEQLPEPDLGQSKLSAILFRIDHMNDSTSYIRKLQLWSDELEMGTVLLYRMRSKSVNASSGGKAVTPKGRAEDIWVLIEGTRDHASEYLSRLRTRKMTGQDRHERKSTVVWDSDSASKGTSKRRIADKFVAEDYR
eukprot:COSAG02_NODE_1355_length_13099_cov_10.562923_9_plen_302_part_00